jgi:transposase
MLHFDPQLQQLIGPGGSLAVAATDAVTRKLAMLMEGECQGLGPRAAAQKFGFSKQRYFQIRRAFLSDGAPALQSQRRGPKRPSRRTEEAVRQVIRHRFLDPEASAEVIAQKLRQAGFPLSTRSVERVLADYGLQKKTLSLAADSGAAPRNPTVAHAEPP